MVARFAVTMGADIYDSLLPLQPCNPLTTCYPCDPLTIANYDSRDNRQTS